MKWISWWILIYNVYFVTYIFCFRSKSFTLLMLMLNIYFFLIQNINNIKNTYIPRCSAFPPSLDRSLLAFARQLPDSCHEAPVSLGCRFVAHSVCRRSKNEWPHTHGRVSSEIEWTRHNQFSGEYICPRVIKLHLLRKLFLLINVLPRAIR